jgi:hypothetical protein
VSFRIFLLGVRNSPAIPCPGTDPASGSLLEKEGRNRTSIMACCRLLLDFVSTPGHPCSDTKLAQEVFRDEPERLFVFLRILDINIHKDGESAAQPSGLFVVGSKFTHSCTPNCSWKFLRSNEVSPRSSRQLPDDVGIGYFFILLFVQSSRLLRRSGPQVFVEDALLHAALLSSRDFVPRACPGSSSRMCVLATFSAENCAAR